MPSDTSGKLVIRTTDLAQQAWKRHPKTVVTTGVALAAWLTLTAWLYTIGCPSALMQGWIEIANGATWATNWLDLCLQNHGLFAFAVATRTALNFAGPLAVIGTGVWFLSGGLERAMKMSRHEVMRMLSVEIVSSLAALVRHNHPETYVDDELQQMQVIADKVVDGYLRDVEELDKDEAQERR